MGGIVKTLRENIKGPVQPKSFHWWRKCRNKASSPAQHAFIHMLRINFLWSSSNHANPRCFIPRRNFLEWHHSPGATSLFPCSDVICTMFINTAAHSRMMSDRVLWGLSSILWHSTRSSLQKWWNIFFRNSFFFYIFIFILLWLCGL